jgi:hypothetical protein
VRFSRSTTIRLPSEAPGGTGSIVCWVELHIEGQPPVVAVQHQVELGSGQEASTKQREVRPIATETQTLRQCQLETSQLLTVFMVGAHSAGNKTCHIGRMKFFATCSPI